MELENPPENPCFGCGPSHARGLRLRFAREGDEILVQHTPKPDEIGWPGLFHTGLHFTTLFEAAYWAAWELTGVVHVARGPQTFDQERLPRVGEAFTARARVVERAPSHVRVEVESTRHDGKRAGRLVVTLVPQGRAAIEKSGLRLPGYLTDGMAP